MSAELVKIKSMRNSFSDARKRLADYILLKGDEMLLLSVHDLARGAGVSVATVSRFAHALGYESFKDFRAQISKDSLTLNSFKNIYQAITPDDTDKDIIGKAFSGNIKSLEDTLRILNVSDLIKAGKLIAKCDRLVCFGIGSSKSIADDVALRFSQLNIQAEAYSDSYQILNQVSRMGKGDIAFGVSHSGRSAITVKAMRLARERGAATLGISNYLSSPLEKSSGIFLCTSFPETRVQVAALSSRIAQVCLVDALYLLVARHKEEHVKRTEYLNTITEQILREPEK